MLKQFLFDLKKEFSNYNITSFRMDLLAGLTVTAVALPLALAFGVSSGASASAGLITAILGGLIIGALSGASFQISGPTGAMGAVLLLVFQKYGLEGVWIAGLLAGIILVITGILKLGKIVSFIPAPVIIGFTSGIASIIAIGQLDNFFGTTTNGSESAAIKLFNFIKGPITINWSAVLLGIIVILIMIIWPKKWNKVVPSSLIGLLVAVGINIIFEFPVTVIGQIPKTLLPEARLTLSNLDFSIISGLISPAISIAALGLIETLLCGEVAKKMANKPFNANQELIAQGVGNIIIPFFGGIPATAAIARTSVGIKAGGQTRLVGIFHALFLLLSMFILAPVMSKIPLAALAGVLMMTALRMNEWANIRYVFSKRFKGAISKFLITMVATIALDLTQAILIGVIFSMLLFIVRISNVEISVSDVDAERLNKDVNDIKNLENIKVVYFTGPLFFGTVNRLKETLDVIENTNFIILSMRGVPLIDVTGLQALHELRDELAKKGCILMLCGLQPQVREHLSRSGLDKLFGDELIFWSADQAILATKQLTYN